jgi:hypothetical protein
LRVERSTDADDRDVDLHAQRTLELLPEVAKAGLAGLNLPGLDCVEHRTLFGRAGIRLDVVDDRVAAVVAVLNRSLIRLLNSSSETRIAKSMSEVGAFPAARLPWTTTSPLRCAAFSRINFAAASNCSLVTP